MNERALVERVGAELRARGLTARQAAVKGGGSNTTWSAWLQEGGRPGPTLQQAVAKAFGWSTDWPDNPPPFVTPEQQASIDSLKDEISQLRDVVGSLLQQVEELGEANMAAHDRTGVLLTELSRRLPPGGRGGTRRAQ
jgi:transcriptional regulator with XRE-family HTH domain